MERSLDLRRLTLATHRPHFQRAFARRLEPSESRHNWRARVSVANGDAAAVMYTLTATCRRLRIDPYAYLRDVFERLPQLRATSSDAEDETCLLPLLPDRWLAEHPESQLPMRTTESNNKAARRRDQRRQTLARATRKR